MSSVFIYFVWLNWSEMKYGAIKQNSIRLCSNRIDSFISGLRDWYGRGRRCPAPARHRFRHQASFRVCSIHSQDWRHRKLFNSKSSLNAQLHTFIKNFILFKCYHSHCRRKLRDFRGCPRANGAVGFKSPVLHNFRKRISVAWNSKTFQPSRNSDGSRRF